MRKYECIDQWLGKARAYFSVNAPQLLGIFDTYSAEARFSVDHIRGDLESLRPDAKILEVGAGSFLLTCFLKSAGYQIVGLEPVGDGFSHFDQMRTLVLRCAAEDGIEPEFLGAYAEDLDVDLVYDYAFSINVMEHVGNVDRVIERVGRALKLGCFYRFTCANYAFPYEPHFNIPTLFSKRLTRYVFDSRIRSKSDLLDNEGIWASLNWITAASVKRSVRKIPSLKVKMNTYMLEKAVERLATDREFAARRSPFMLRFVAFLVAVKVHKLFWIVPAEIQPLIDCWVEKISTQSPTTLPQVAT
ncbi:class I SAM-dependent methyltransferase [Neorhizobium sp. BETTINA12A]|uniref:class I SAM-dependent methyltransferase n=1 Tax=Neorhizobium sp. BETTINA12A TaxID=2908924 RepID=UPI001FF3DDDB|nr:class I SAM-dependent methyltransferase [Neorhizobium sp. BETTINA12A]MCJ9751930.1 class I SAM-dependent methyltransferase [Neorhizobium sp. BETTINA12A]